MIGFLRPYSCSLRPLIAMVRPSQQQQQRRQHQQTFPHQLSDDVDVSYDDAVRCLNSLQSNRQTLDKIRREKDSKRHLSVPNTLRYLARAGIRLAELDRLSVVHVSGTKGKGSTCAFAESVLRHHGFRTGFFSSPHLVEVRERIRIDGDPLAKGKFAAYFWDVYNPMLKASEDETLPAIDDANMPAYFQFLTIMAIHAFLKENVDVAVIEVGIGGEFDSTNIFPSPVVCGVTALGIDHTALLGSTITSIAWHKAGIFKPNALAFTVPQPVEAMRVLRDRAAERGSSLRVVSSILTSYCSFDAASPAAATAATDDYVDSGSGNPLKIGIHGEPQFWNASLALHLAQAWMESRTKGVVGENGEGMLQRSITTEPRLAASSLGDSDPGSSIPSSSGSLASPITLSPPTSARFAEGLSLLPTATPFPLRPAHLAGLRRTFWPGRSQIVKMHADLTLYLDGAHTEESLKFCASWFREETLKEIIRHEGVEGMYNEKERGFYKVLLFNVTGGRSPRSLLKYLLRLDFDAAVFCPNVSSSPSSSGGAVNVSVDQTSLNTDEEANKRTCLNNLQAWIDLNSNPPSPADSSFDNTSISSPTSTPPAFYLPSISDALDFLNVNNNEVPLCEGKAVPRPSWLRPGVRLQVLATGSLYLVGGVLKLADPDLGGVLSDDE